jgi:Tol biopolymer transport system component
MRGSFRAAGLGAGLALMVAAPAVTATTHGGNGRITYAVQDDTGQQQIWIAEADETNPVQLTFAANTSLATDWSPDASRIAFDSDRTGDVEVYTMKPDGSDVVRLTFDPGFDAAPAYSPDGSTLVWDHEAADASQNGLYLMRASDGGAVRRLTVAPQDAARFVIDIDPQFSPDGRRVAFSRFRLADHGTVSAIHVVDADGSHLRQVTPWGSATSTLDWSPDGRRLVYETETWHFPGKKGTQDIMIVNPDGSGRRNLTRNPISSAVGSCQSERDCTGLVAQFSTDPVWAPDGSRILFVHTQLVDGVFSCDLQTIRPDGSARRVVAATPECEDEPDWESLP